MRFGMDLGVATEFDGRIGPTELPRCLRAVRHGQRVQEGSGGDQTVTLRLADCGAS